MSRFSDVMTDDLEEGLDEVLHALDEDYWESAYELEQMGIELDEDDEY